MKQPNILLNSKEEYEEHLKLQKIAKMSKSNKHIGKPQPPEVAAHLPARGLNRRFLYPTQSSMSLPSLHGTPTKATEPSKVTMASQPQSSEFNAGGTPQPHPPAPAEQVANVVGHTQQGEGYGLPTTNENCC